MGPCKATGWFSKERAQVCVCVSVGAGSGEITDHQEGLGKSHVSMDLSRFHTVPPELLV